jgi:hypothetical protein
MCVLYIHATYVYMCVDMENKCFIYIYLFTCPIFWKKVENYYFQVILMAF